MSTVKLLIEVSQDLHIEIEEFCHRHGLDFSRYFIDLHKKASKQNQEKEMNEAISKAVESFKESYTKSEKTAAEPSIATSAIGDEEEDYFDDFDEEEDAEPVPVKSKRGRKKKVMDPV